MGALKGVEAGVFGPPSMSDLDYDGLRNLVTEAREGLAGYSAETVNGFEGKAMEFRMGKMAIPFNAEDFLLHLLAAEFLLPRHDDLRHAAHEGHADRQDGLHGPAAHEEMNRLGPAPVETGMDRRMNNTATMRVVGVALLAIVLFAVPASARELKTAVFAGGCFWCMEPPFDELDGVVATTSGYTGGRSKSPTYKQVTFGDTGHLESVKVTYDADQVDYATLLEVYWRNIDPVDNLGQFCDKGSSYRAAIFVDGDAERELAERTKTAN